jgi:hypothetical protein
MLTRIAGVMLQAAGGKRAMEACFGYCVHFRPTVFTRHDIPALALRLKVQRTCIAHLAVSVPLPPATSQIVTVGQTLQSRNTRAKFAAIRCRHRYRARPQAVCIIPAMRVIRLGNLPHAAFPPMARGTSCCGSPSNWH